LQQELSQSRSDPSPIPASSGDAGLPHCVLYATSARIGGSGLSGVAYESLKGVHGAGILGRAIAYDQHQAALPSRLIRSLRWHPVRLLSGLASPYYYGAKRQYVDWIASRELARGGYDLFHGWSGDALLTLRQARREGIPSVLEIPTWHRNKGKRKPWMTRGEKEAADGPLPGRLLRHLLVNRQRVLEEYELADVVLVLSQKAIETFEAVGFPTERLFKLERGVDVTRFTPAPPPPVFRVIFVGALIRRKGVHHLLEAWHRLNLKEAELVLVGSVHEEMKPYLQQYAHPSVRVTGFARRPEELYRQASLHVLPSTCEGSAKTTYEAAASGLAQIATRESGDVVRDGENGWIIPANDVDALAEALRSAYDWPDRRAEMGRAARRLMEERYTWDHFRARLLEAYRLAVARAGKSA